MASGPAGSQSVRDYVSIVGSSTVYPFATVVAEHARNLVQYVVYFEQGEDVRHMGTRRDATVAGV